MRSEVSVEIASAFAAILSSNGLLDTETIEVKKLTGASGVISSIPEESSHLFQLV